MKTMPTESPATEYLGHVKNGVVVLDTHVSLTEGQAVRVEPLQKEPATSISGERAEQLQRMKTLFAQWREEDSSLPDEEGDVLQNALQANRGLTFRTAHIE
jgi:hypothetical protein